MVDELSISSTTRDPETPTPREAEDPEAIERTGDAPMLCTEDTLPRSITSPSRSSRYLEIFRTIVSRKATAVLWQLPLAVHTKSLPADERTVL